MKPSEALYFKRLLRPVKQHLTPGVRVLDAGCGNGVGSEVLQNQGCEVTGIDIEAQTQAWAAPELSGIEFRTGSIEALPDADNTFDAVWVKDVLHHTNHPQQALRELLRVTRPGGKVIVIEANRYNPVFYVHLTLFGQHDHFTGKQLHKMLKMADPDYTYTKVESRCLPWQSAWLLRALQVFENVLEASKILSPWLTYQIGVITVK